MSIRHGLVFAMEDDQVITDEVVENTGEIEAGAAEVVQQAGEVEELQAAIEDAEEGAETLGQIEGVLEESAESGEGVDETAAEIAEVAVESICARLGIRAAKKSFPAMEAFGSSNSRLSATKIALEGIGEHIKRIWEAIKSAIIRLVEKVKSFFIGLLKNTGLVITHLEKLLERAKSLPDDAKPKNADLSNKSLARAFSIDKKADLNTAKKIVANGGKLLESAKVLADASAKFSGEIEKAAGEASVEGGYDKAREALETNVTTSLIALGKLASSHGSAGEDKEKTLTYYGPFVGTRVLALKNDVKTMGEDTYHDFSLTVTTYDKIEADKITALKREEVYDLVKQGLSLMDQLKAFEKAQKEIQKTSDNVRKAAEKATSSLNKAADEEKDAVKSRALKSISKDVTNVNSITASVGVAIPATVFATGKAVADYASASIANLTSGGK